MKFDVNIKITGPVSMKKAYKVMEKEIVKIPQVINTIMPGCDIFP